MANAVYRFMFDDLSMMTSPENGYISRHICPIIRRKYVRRFNVEPSSAEDGEKEVRKCACYRGQFYVHFLLCSLLSGLLLVACCRAKAGCLLARGLELWMFMLYAFMRGVLWAVQTD